MHNLNVSASRLTHHVQSISSVTDHYRGNRQRNQLVREDFPTARGEQEKELQIAEHQAARYQEMVQQQANADALVARRLADRIERDAERTRQAQAEQDEALGRQLAAAMQLQQQQQLDAAMYGNNGSPQKASPRSADSDIPTLPPKNFPQRLPDGQLPAANVMTPPTRPPAQHRTPPNVDQQRPSTSKSKSSPLNYVSLDLPQGGHIPAAAGGKPAHLIPRRSGDSNGIDADGGSSTASSLSRTQYTEIVPAMMAGSITAACAQAHSHSGSSASSTASNSIISSPHKSHYDHLELQSHTPEKPLNDGPALMARDANRNPTRKTLSYSQQQQQLHADEIHRIDEHDQYPFNVNAQQMRPNSQQQQQHQLANHQRQTSATSADSTSTQTTTTTTDTDVQYNLATGRAHNVQKLSLEKYDLLVGNLDGAAGGASNGESDAVDGNQMGRMRRTDAGPQYEANGNSEWEYRRGSPPHQQQQQPASSSKTMDRVRQLQEFGVPADEIVEINRMITQQERDEVRSLRKIRPCKSTQ